MAAGGVLGGFILILSLGLFIFGRQFLALPLAQLQTLVFITLVFSGQGTVYLVRERLPFWRSAPSGWLLASIGDMQRRPLRCARNSQRKSNSRARR
jgi:H+-transporting ATPase